jgi:hypothetical protein
MLLRNAHRLSRLGKNPPFFAQAEISSAQFLYGKYQGMPRDEAVCA